MRDYNLFILKRQIIKKYLHFLKKWNIPLKSSRNVAQPGSALVWGASGRGFKSRHSDHLEKINADTIKCPLFLYPAKAQ